MKWLVVVFVVTCFNIYWSDVGLTQINMAHHGGSRRFVITLRECVKRKTLLFCRHVFNKKKLFRACLIFVAFCQKNVDFFLAGGGRPPPLDADMSAKKSSFFLNPSFKEALMTLILRYMAPYLNSWFTVLLIWLLSPEVSWQS